ncbi:MAG: hypothetical protein AABY22_17105, partial [Nanoarchaeota archaeon]
MKKINLLLMATMLISIVLLNTASADQTQLLCLTDGQTVEFSLCNPAIPDYTCNSDVCQVCVKRLSSGIYCSRSPNACNTLGLSCSSLGDNGTSVDGEPPVINVNSPQDNSAYDSRKVLFSLNSSEAVTFYYRHAEEVKWRKLSRGILYNKFVNLREGQNNIIIRGVDLSGNSAEINKSFFFF